MKKYLNVMAIFLLLTLTSVNAASCSLEDQVKINDEAGLVNVSAEPYEYEYVGMIEDTGESSTFTAYLGSINIYNLTENLYAIVSNGQAKKTINYYENNGGVNQVSTGSMEMLKTYTVSIYPTNTRCGRTAIREFQITVPLENPYYKMAICSENPDYFYCSQFLNIENISRDDFSKGIEEYINQKKKKEEEKRKEGIIDLATSFFKRNWLAIVIVIIIIISGITTYIYLRNKKRKEQIV